MNSGFETNRLRNQVDFKVEAKVSYKSYFKSRFMFYKKMMNADLRNYIDISKEENMKKLKKKVQELKGGLELMLNKKDSDVKSTNCS